MPQQGGEELLRLLRCKLSKLWPICGEKRTDKQTDCGALLAPHLFVLGLVFLISCFWLIDLMNI